MNSNEHLLTKAMQLRKRLAENTDSPIYIFAIAQNIDRLTIVYYPMGDNLSGICLKSRQGINVIAVNSAMTLGRQRFSLAHELYHLYYDRNMSAICAKTIGMGDDTEREADLFASYFLMPSVALHTKAEDLKAKNDAHNLSLIEVIRIEQYFGVSHQAAVIRLKQEGLLMPTEAEAMMQSSVTRLAESMGYSTDLYKPLPVGKQHMTYGHYIQQAEQVFERGLVSEGKYEELLLSAFRSDIVYGEIEEGGGMID